LWLLRGGEPQWPAIKGLFVGVVEFQPTTPGLSLVHAVHDDVNADVLSLLLVIDLPDIAHMKVAPEKVCRRHRNGDQVAPVDGDAGTLSRDGLISVFYIPLAQPDIPQGQRLEGGGLPQVVWADEDNGLAEFDIGLAKPLEVPNAQSCQHVNASLTRGASVCRTPG